MWLRNLSHVRWNIQWRPLRSLDSVATHLSHSPIPILSACRKASSSSQFSPFRSLLDVQARARLDSLQKQSAFQETMDHWQEAESRLKVCSAISAPSFLIPLQQLRELENLFKTEQNEDLLTVLRDEHSSLASNLAEVVFFFFDFLLSPSAA